MVIPPAIAVLHPANPAIRQQELHQQYHLPGYFNPNSNPNFVTDQRAQDQNVNMIHPVVHTQAYSMEVPNIQKPTDEFPALSVDKEKDSKTEEDKPSYAMVARTD